VTEGVARVDQPTNPIDQGDHARVKETLPALGRSSLFDEAEGDVPIKNLVRDAGLLEDVFRPQKLRGRFVNVSV